MCGRFALALTPRQFRLHFGCPPPPDWRPRWNVAPDSDIVILHAPAPGRRGTVWARWGLVRPGGDGRAALVINARVETVAERPLFRRALARGRVLVPVSGFYEWQRPSQGPARPFFVRRRDGLPLALAAVRGERRLSDGRTVAAVAILTREAPPELRSLHPRMPVPVPAESWEAWLDPRRPGRDALAAVLRPPAEEELEWYEVSRRVNDPREDDADLVRPWAEEAPTWADLPLFGGR